MFWGTTMFLPEGFTFALIISGVLGVLNAVARTVYSRRAITAQVIAFVINLVLLTIFCTLIIWWWMPAQTGTLWGHAWLIWPILVSGLIYLITDFIIATPANNGRDNADEGIGAGGVLGVLGALLLMVFFVFNLWDVRSTSQARQLASLVNAVPEAASTYPTTDDNHILMVPEEAATLLAQQHIAGVPIEINGKSTNLATVYQLGPASLQSVNHHLWWLFDLEFSNYSTWKSVKVTPGFIAVDAEDPDATPKYYGGFRMRYVPNAWFGNKLKRVIYDAGYTDYIIDDITLEVDENWQPFYTASLNKKTLHNAGIAPRLMLVIDPQTKTITKYGADEAPDWVDRVYSMETVKKMVTAWGNYNKDTPDWRWRDRSRPKTNRLTIGDVIHPVYTTSDHPAWQFTLVGLKNHSSTVYLALFDMRDNTLHLYSSVAGTASESTVKTAFTNIEENASGNGKYQVLHLAMHKIYGRMTWVANYVTIPTEENPGHAYAGIGFVSATDVNVASVAFDQEKAKALRLYRQKLARPSNTGAPGEGAQEQQTVTGTILEITSVIIDGQQEFLIRLGPDASLGTTDTAAGTEATPVATDDPNRLYQAPASTELDLVELAFTKVGHHVVIVFSDFNSNPVEISQFNDLDVPIVP